MADKIEGATSTCSDCGQLTVCRMIEYDGKQKLQWQDEKEEKAHYSFDFKTKKVACKHANKKVASKGLFGTSKSELDPTAEQFLEIAKKLLKDDTDIKDIDEFVKQTQVTTRRAAAKTAVRWASIIGVMDEIGLQHPSRIAFIKDVLN